MSELSRIQQELKANKGQYNAFGKYKYRSCEDILESVKPLLKECSLTLTDDLVLIGDRYYIKATARLITMGRTHLKPDGSLESIEDGDFFEVSSFAREPIFQKGMSDSQITGSASSYARKYALNGLFCIDDTKDDDTRDNSQQKNTNGSGGGPRGAGPNPVGFPSDAQKSFYNKLLKTKYKNEIPQDVIETAKGMNSVDMSNEIGRLKKELGFE